MATTMQTEVKFTADAIDVSQLKAVELADGWHDITRCELVQFAIGEAHSPITPTRLFPALRYQNEFGRVVRTPINKVLSFSEERQSER